MSKRNTSIANEENEKEAERLRKRDLSDLRFILETEQGRRFCRRILEEGKVFSSTFTGNSTTFFLEGQRSLALKLFDDMCEAAPHKIADIIIKEGV